MAYGQPASPSAAGKPLRRYDQRELLGRGAMGAVYAARDRVTGKRVAIKVLHPQFGTTSAIAMRFAREARALRAIKHPNVTRLIDVIEDGSCRAYVMERLRGESLRALLDHKPQLSLDTVYAIAMQVAAGLSAVHAAHVVHRDIKPENIFCHRRSDGAITVKLLDFGIAKVLGPVPTTNRPDATGAGTMLGTPEYMAPEQVRGEPTDERADIYAFGVLLYEMLCGHPPFTAHNVGELVIQLMVVAPQPPSTVAPHRAIPRALDKLVMRCLAKHPQGRPASMAVVRAQLLAVADAMNAPTRIMRVEEIDAIIARARKTCTSGTTRSKSGWFLTTAETGS